MATMERESTYVLGHSQSELDRLAVQARFYGDLSEQAFRMAGITPGMSVLDIGCGNGDLAFLLGSLVGPAGMVTGVDKSAEAIERAQARARAAGVTNVHFVVGDATEYRHAMPVDMIVGRLIVIHLADPVAAIRHLSTMVKPGGLVMFQDFDMVRADGGGSALATTAIGWVNETFRRIGGNPNTGSQLPRLFRLAALPTPQMIGGTRVETGADSYVYEYLAQTIRSLVPVITKVGVVTAAEIDIETLAERLRADAIANDAVVLTPLLISAWSRTAS